LRVTFSITKVWELMSVIQATRSLRRLVKSSNPASFRKRLAKMSDKDLRHLLMDVQCLVQAVGPLQLAEIEVIADVQGDATSR